MGLEGLMEEGVSWLTGLAAGALAAAGVNPVVQSLVIDGVFAGVGSMLSFLPLIVVLFLLLSMLEDSGYMARVAFVMDKVLRRFGLSGRSFVPMLVGFGCSVPAIMATRTLPSEHDRKMTVMLTPFMSCSAKLPVYGLLTAAFFARNSVLAMVSLYLLGVAVAAVVALVLKRTAFKGEPVPFIMELPNYRLPSAKTTVMLAWDKAKDFIQRAFTIIFAASIVVWFLQTFDGQLNVVSDQSQSLLAGLGGIIAPARAARLWRSARLDGARDRTARQGERDLHARGAAGDGVRLGAYLAVHAAYRLCLPRVHAAVPAVRGGNRCGEERAGPALGGRGLCLAMRGGVNRCVRRAHSRHRLGLCLAALRVIWERPCL